MKKETDEKEQLQCSPAVGAGCSILNSECSILGDELDSVQTYQINIDGYLQDDQGRYIEGPKG